MATQQTLRAEALRLSEELLGEIELSAIGPAAVARKSSRLARLLDDTDAMAWLHFEVSGYPRPFPREAYIAAKRSNRYVRKDPKGPGGDTVTYWTESLGEMSALIDAGRAQLNAATDPPVSLNSANPNQWVKPPAGNTVERGVLRQSIAAKQATIDAIVGSMHAYVAEKYQELRFGAAVETSFEVVRREVDASIGALVPEALPMLSAAFENASSNNPEDWANAAGTCRRLLKAVADELRPPGGKVDGRKMGEGNYINRLIDWIANNSDSSTAAKMITSDLKYLGERIDAADGAGQKGAHDAVDRFDASRFITGTYLILGDVLRIAPPRQTIAETEAIVEVSDAEANKSEP